MVLVLLSGEFAHCVPSSPSLGALQLQQRVGLLTEESEVKAHWDGYFERLYQADSPAVELDVRGITIPIAGSDLDFADDAVIFAETGYPCGGLRGAE